MGKVIALCGKPGSGKSTLSVYIKENFNAIPFSADKYMLNLFGEIQDRKIFENKLSICKELIYDVSQEIITYANVVLDFGFWRKNERDYLRQKFNNEVVFIYIKLDDDQILNQIKIRNSQLANGEYYMDIRTYEILASMFEEPVCESDVIIYTSEEELQKTLPDFL